jgi:uncharacterized membrane protein YvbJ
VFCPTCNTANLHTSIRCAQCGTSLIVQSVGASDSFEKHARPMNARMYAGIGATIGFVVFIVLNQTVLETMYLDKNQVLVGASVFSAVGAAIGRLIARKQYL